MESATKKQRVAVLKEAGLEDYLEAEGGKHQAEMQGLLDAICTQEVQESSTEQGKLENIMKIQSRTGVIYATRRASQFGFKGAGDPAWGNLGQGAPETIEIPNQPDRSHLKVELDPESNEYADTNGDGDFRQAVADYYNHHFRQGKESKYTWQNVAVTSGGRSGLCRLMAALSNVNVGYFLPDYTAYSQLLGTFPGVSPIAVGHDVEGITTSAEHLRKSVKLAGLGAFLLSNPTNPSGNIVEGEALNQWVKVAREEACLFMMDEFYSHYMYEEKLPGDKRPFHTFSSAEFVEDVNKDPICIINGLTKNWRLPGWRVCWVVGPTHCIDALSAVGSFMDGGAPHPMQRAAIPLLHPDFVKADALALQAHFREKRDYMLKELRALGIKVRKPEATFYMWADVSGLPAPLNNGVIFFEHCIRNKVIAVPGIFFDVNPFNRRRFHQSPYLNHLRMSYGPAWPNLKQAVEGMTALVALAKAGNLPPLVNPCKSIAENSNVRSGHSG